MTDQPDEWQEAAATFQYWMREGHTVEEFTEAVVAQQYEQDFPQLTAAETELWERAIGTDGTQLPPLVRLRLQGFTWHQAIGCLPGLWLSRPEDTHEIDRLKRELRERDAHGL